MGEWGGGKLIRGSCGIDVEDLETAARCPGESQRVLYLWSMGMNQSSEGTAEVRSLIGLHLVTGEVKKPAAGLFSVTRGPNAIPIFLEPELKATAVQLNLAFFSSRMISCQSYSKKAKC